MTAFPRAFWPGCASTPWLLGATWLAQLILGLALQHLDPLPSRPLLIERRSCAPGEWAELVRRYRPLHRQHQWRRQRLDPVILTGVFGERTLPEPPTPEQLQQQPAVGVAQEQRVADLRRRHPDALLLRCGAPEAFPDRPGAQDAAQRGWSRISRRTSPAW